MGRRKTKKIVPVDPTPPAPSLASTLRKYCGCCNKKFSDNHLKTRKFVSKDGTEGNEGLQNTIEFWEGVQEIFRWRYGNRFTGSIDKTLALCPNCGIIVAKLYTIIKLFDDARTEMGYLSKLADSIWNTDSKVEISIDEAEADPPLSPTVPHEEGVDDSQNEDHTVFTLDFQGGDEDILTNFCVKENTSKVKDNSDKAFLCHLCSAGFNKQTNLTRHLLLSHGVGNREKEFQCSVCGREYYFSYLLKNHEKIHEEVRPFVCTFPDCAASFKSKLGLHAHTKCLHRPTRPFKCRFCTKDFKDQRGLRIHEGFVHRLPQGMQPWVCEFCEIRYRRKHALRSHRLKCLKNPNRVKDLEDEIETAVMNMEVGMEVTVEATAD